MQRKTNGLRIEQNSCFFSMSDSATCSKSYQEFAKFGRFFTTRLVQAVVQSRLGNLMVQACNVQPDPTDWFSVRIDELGEVAAHLRTSVSEYPPKASYFTLDFLLHTADGDVLPLESWCIHYDSDLIDANVNVRTELYHQLGTLLKSAIVASRMTPAYRYYVRKQSSDTYIIMYRVYEKEPEMDLGEEQKKVRIGTVASPFGGFLVDLHYRTKMEIDRAAHETSVDTVSALENAGDGNTCKKDLQASVAIPFGPVPAFGGAIEPVSPVSDRVSNFSVDLLNEERACDILLGTPSRRVHFQLGLDRSSTPPYSSSLPHRVPFPSKGRARTHSFPFSTLLTTASTNMVSNLTASSLLADNDVTTPVHPFLPTPTSVSGNSSHLTKNENIYMHQCATVPCGVNLMNRGEGDIPKKSTDVEADIQSDDEDTTSSDNSFVKVAFGSSESLTDGLGEFMKQCRSAPTHLSFQIDRTEMIPELLAQFEDKQKVFDEFIAEIKRKTQVDEE